MRSEPGLALVMAAGQSRRFGQQDKRLAKLAGQPLLSISLERAQQCYPLVVVALRQEDSHGNLGFTSGATKPEIAHYYCQNPQRGLGANLAQSVGWIDQQPQYANVQWLAVLLADMPFISDATQLALQQWANKHNIVRPMWRGKAGHPVLFGRDYWPQLMALQGDQGAAAVLRSNVDRVKCVDVEDSGVCFDIDTEQALLRARSKLLTLG